MWTSSKSISFLFPITTYIFSENILLEMTHIESSWFVDNHLSTYQCGHHLLHLHGAHFATTKKGSKIGALTFSRAPERIISKDGNAQQKSNIHTKKVWSQHCFVYSVGHGRGTTTTQICNFFQAKSGKGRHQLKKNVFFQALPE